MTNREYVESLNDEEFAEMLVREDRFDNAECRYDDYVQNYATEYVAPNDNRFATFNEAVIETIVWLNEFKK